MGVPWGGNTLGTKYFEEEKLEEEEEGEEKRRREGAFTSQFVYSLLLFMFCFNCCIPFPHELISFSRVLDVV